MDRRLFQGKGYNFSQAGRGNSARAHIALRQIAALYEL